MSDLRAPFPWWGGKSAVAPLVWERFGDVANYSEPFFGTGAMLLGRPSDHIGRVETVNDKDGFVSNFWRAVQRDPDAVAHHADWPVSENDLHARHAWLVTHGPDITARLEGDPEFYDAKVAGWWVWGICSWIGSGWCSGTGPWRVCDGELVNAGTAGQGINRQLPHLGDAGRGINRQLPHLGTAGQGINRKLPHLGDAGRGINRQLPHLGTAGRGETSSHLYQVMRDLSERLRRVRVCSGDWTRVVTESVTTRHGLTAVFLDPPYAVEGRTADLYRHEMTVADAVREWAIANGNNPLMRIALCGYEGEHNLPDDWITYRWKARGGYGSQGKGTRGAENSHRETIWFSPHCLRPNITDLPLFAALEGIA